MQPYLLIHDGDMINNIGMGFIQWKKYFLEAALLLLQTLESLQFSQ